MDDPKQPVQPIFVATNADDFLAEMQRLGGSVHPFSIRTKDGSFDTFTGICLRDWFAGQALVGLLSAGLEVKGSVPGTAQRVLSEAAYLVADAMLSKRGRDKATADEKSPDWLRTGVQFWASRRGEQERLLWTVMEPSTHSNGWLCASDCLESHSNNLTLFEKAW